MHRRQGNDRLRVLEENHGDVTAGQTKAPREIVTVDFVDHYRVDQTKQYQLVIQDKFIKW